MPALPFTSTKLVRGLSRRAAVAWRSRSVMMRNRRPIATFTFDDCPRSAIANGATILADRGLRGSFYLSGALAGSLWDDSVQYEVSDIPALLAAGHEVGCHTFSHLDCATAPADVIASELTINRQFLERAAPGIELATFAYPYGRVGITSKSVVQQRFAACRGVETGVNIGTADMGLLKAVGVPSDADAVDHLRPLIDRAAAANGWLVFYTHDVSRSPSPYGCSPQHFAALVDTVLAAGFDVMTLRTAADVVAAPSAMHAPAAIGCTQV